MTGNKQVLYTIIFGVLAILAIIALGFENIESAVTYSKELLGYYEYDCVDSDPLNDYYVKGFVKKGNYEYSDKCIDNKVFQMFCKSSQRKSMTRAYTCPNGCEDGACIRLD